MLSSFTRPRIDNPGKKSLHSLGCDILRLLRITLGIASIVLGLLGLVLPVLQGWFFLVFGLISLYRDVPFVDRIVTRNETRFPIIAQMGKRTQKAL